MLFVTEIRCLSQGTSVLSHIRAVCPGYFFASDSSFMFVAENKKVESEIKAEAKEIRDTVKEKFNKKIGKILTTDSKQSNQDIFDMYDILKKLEKLIL